MTSPFLTKQMMIPLIILGMVVSVAMTVGAADIHHHEGTLVGTGVAKITIMNRDGITVQTLALSDLVHVTRNGRPAVVRDLVKGDLVQLTTDSQLQQESVIQISATSRE